MPLLPAELAELALRMVGANYFDPRAIPGLSQRGRDELKGRLNGIQEAAVRSSNEVADHASLVAFLNAEGRRLETSLAERNETEEARTAVKGVIQALREMASQINADHDGDGPARKAYRCGVIPIAFAVQENVIRAYKVAGAVLPEPAGVPIIYRTYITPDIPHKLGPFNVGGRTRIDISPSEVNIFIRKKADLLARDLWQLAYVFHHELVCHGFQCASQQAPAERKNAPVGCHWTEGWMDAVAFILSKLWVSRDDCKSCFSFGGPAAISEMNEMHQTRYPNPNAADPLKRRPPDISEDDAYLRFFARQAFDALSANLALDRYRAHNTNFVLV
jgi:hypothetical protein